MYKLVIFAAVLALAAAAPAGPPGTIITYSAPIAAPVAAVAYSAPAVIPAPITYHTGYHVAYEVEPVEQHGYSIKY
ncbi:cuticle protein 16.5-like [Ischnura elegans]|uniref:cuticle protein 16.5-like n=1 Tax=Ischnura elegans TaxID=197161 RepID=UPI001ED8AD0E|nr:cuticle protein 16.5-like [Ischnura elegans]